MVCLVIRLDVNAGAPQVLVNDLSPNGSRVRHGNECLAHHVMWIDRLIRSEAVIAWQHHDERFRGDEFEYQIGRPYFSSEERHVELAPDKSIREVGRILARDGDLDIGEFVPKKPDRFGEPVDLLSGQEAQRERQFGGLSSASCRFASRIDLSQRQSGMLEKRPTRGGQLDAVSTANHQLRADLVLKVPNLTTE